MISGMQKVKGTTEIDDFVDARLEMRVRLSRSITAWKDILLRVDQCLSAVVPTFS